MALSSRGGGLQNRNLGVWLARGRPGPRDRPQGQERTCRAAQATPCSLIFRSLTSSDKKATGRLTFFKKKAKNDKFGKTSTFAKCGWQKPDRLFSAYFGVLNSPSLAR